MERWAGRVAVVTGASSGIGAQVARELVKQGLVVVGVARRVDIVQKLAKELTNEKGTLHAMKVDVSNEQEVIDLFIWIDKNLGGVDVLINNAGIGLSDGVLAGSTNGWRELLDVNVLGLSMCAREAVRSMRSKGSEDGVVININSVAGHRVFGPLYSMYTATKFAVTALTESLYNELQASGSRIRVTSLSPGFVNTEAVAKTGNKFPFDLKDILQTLDIAEAVNFVLSTETRVHISELKLKQNIPVHMKPQDQ